MPRYYVKFSTNIEITAINPADVEATLRHILEEVNLEGETLDVDEILAVDEVNEEGWQWTVR